MLVRGSEPATCEIQALAREPIARIEIIANGQMVDEWKSPGKPTQEVNLTRKLDLKGRSWVAARCFLAPGDTIRFAHTSPVYLSGARNSWDARSDAKYFVQWIDDLVSTTNADKARFKSDAERKEVLALYQKARDFYARRAR